MQASYRFTDWLNLGGNYTCSKAEGNFDGETSTSGPVTSGVTSYPEYLRTRWNTPKGYLSIDQRHKRASVARGDILNTKHNRLSVSLLQSYLSGTPYGAAGIDRRARLRHQPRLHHRRRPATTYYFSKRDAYRTDDDTRTDLSFDYAFTLPALGTDLEFFVQPRVTNVFNEQAVDHRQHRGVDLAQLRQGPHQVRPVQRDTAGVHAVLSRRPDLHRHGQLDEGQHLRQARQRPTDYQPPRTFTISFGVRF